MSRLKSEGSTNVMVDASVHQGLGKRRIFEVAWVESHCGFLGCGHKIVTRSAGD